MAKGLRPVMSVSFSTMLPAVGRRRPLMRSNRVDLPAPFGPMMA
jgi:hypothetical protein